jgi:hypothetical protein
MIVDTSKKKLMDKNTVIGLLYYIPGYLIALKISTQL